MEKIPSPNQSTVQPDQSIPTEQTPQPNQQGQTEQLDQPEQPDLSRQEKQKLGSNVIIALTHSEESRESAALEAANQALNDYSKEHKFLTGFPLIGGAVKAGMAYRYLKKARAGISETGNLEGAFEALGLDSSQARTTEGAEATRERAWQALQSAGYSEDNRDVSYESRLDEESVKRDEETEAKIKEALLSHYQSLTNLPKHADPEDARNNAGTELDEAIKKIAEESNLGAINLEAQKQGIQELIDAGESTEEAVRSYLDEHVTLYRASMQESIHTQQKVNGVLTAVATFGLPAGILAGISLSGGAGMGLRNVTGGGIGGVVTGGVAGALRGLEKANIDLSNAEIEAATNFDEVATSEPQISPDAATDPEAVAQHAEDLVDHFENESDQDETDAESKKKRGILAAISEFSNKHLTKKDELLAKIEEKRDRKTAKELIDAIENIGADDPDRRAKLQHIYSEIKARSQFSREKRIDLIKYQESDDKLALEQKLAEIEDGLFDQPEDSRRLLNEEIAKLEDNYAAAEKLRTEYKIRQAAVNAVAGAAAGGIIGGVIGGIAGFVNGSGLASAATAAGGAEGVLGGLSDASPTEAVSTGVSPEALNGLGNNSAELVPDPDGGYSLVIDGKEMIGEGDNPGITFGEDGSLTNESKEMFEAAGIEIEEKVIPHTVEGAHTNVSLTEYFNADNQVANNLVEASSRAWHSDMNGYALGTIGNSYLDGAGNIVVPVDVTEGSNLNIDDMKLFITPGDGNESLGIALDVNADGNVVIPADSPAASFFNGDGFQGGYAELVQEGADGHMDVYSTIGDGHPGVSSVTVDNPGATYNTYEYTITANDQTYEIADPGDSAAAARMEATTGIEPVKGTGEPVGTEVVAGTTSLQTTSGEAVEVEHLRHYGGYNDAYDSYFGEKDGVYNSGESVVRSMVGEDANGLSAQEVDRIFLEKVNSGEIAEGDIVEELLKTKGNSPESIVTTRALLGDFYMDIDGDGVAELIDTQDELNAAADILSRDPEAYDAFVNDTYDLFYSKIEGGSIRIVDYTQEQYQYTTWGELGEDNNVLQRLGLIGNNQTDGVGIVFTDKDGNSIYDENIARSLWRLPAEYDISYIGDRLNCIQNTIAGDFTTIDVPPTTTTTTPPVVPPDTPPDTPPTPPDNPPTPPDNPPSIEPKDAENLTRIDQNIDNDIANNIGTDEIQHHTDLGVGEQTSQPTADDYQGTSATTVPNDQAAAATPVQDTISQDNDYSQDLGGANDGAYSPVQPDDAGQNEANAAEQPIESAPSNDGGAIFEDIMAEYNNNNNNN